MGVSLTWHDMMTGATSASPGVSAPTFAVIKGAIKCDRFAKGDEKHFAAHFTHGFAPGSAIFPHVHWYPSDSGAGNARFGFEWSYARGYSQDVLSETATLYVDQAAAGVLLTHQIAEAAEPGLTIATAETDGVIIVRMFRANTAEDTYGGSCFVSFIDWHVQFTHIGTTARNKGAGWVPAD